ncbi:MAG: hypothetical protein E7311_01250 [Clostridiales bacterium]|nr:hypothetical protein [Clostridiales bacterium]
MSLDPNKFKDSNKKQAEKMGTVIGICLLLSVFLGPLPIIYMVYYIFKNASKTIKTDYTYTSNDIEQNENLFEELQDSSSQNHYKYDINDISQEEIHEHREDFWNVNSPIKYK